MTGAVLVARQDSVGDVLLAGPAIRAVAASAEHVVLLCSPAGAAAAELLPGVSEIITCPCPWIEAHPTRPRKALLDLMVSRVAAERADEALVLTSFHQSPLPTALVLRMAGIGRIGAISTDYPGALLDVRLCPDVDVPEALPEAERALAVATAMGFRLPAGDDGRLRVRALPDIGDLALPEHYTVVHPGASAPARTWPVSRHRATVAALRRAGRDVVVTGTAGERGLTALVAGGDARDLGGRTTLAGLAAVLAGADAVVVGNTGPAHLAAAVDTPVVSLFSPVVPAVKWAPYGVDHVLLGDQHAPCRDTRARTCPVPGHPCLNQVTPADVVVAVDRLAGQPSRSTVSASTAASGTSATQESW